VRQSSRSTDSLCVDSHSGVCNTFYGLCSMGHTPSGAYHDRLERYVLTNLTVLDEHNVNHLVTAWARLGRLPQNTVFTGVVDHYFKILHKFTRVAVRSNLLLSSCIFSDALCSNHSQQLPKRLASCMASRSFNMSHPACTSIL